MIYVVSCRRSHGGGAQEAYGKVLSSSHCHVPGGVALMSTPRINVLIDTEPSVIKDSYGARFPPC